MYKLKTMQWISKQYWQDVFDPALILKTTLQTIIGSVLVGSFFMVFSDFVFKPAKMSGRWLLVLKPNSADHKKLACVNLQYSVLFAQNKVTLIGSGEKASESQSLQARCNDQSIETRTYAPGKDNIMTIEGFIENNYISRDKLVLSYKEGKGPLERQRHTVVELYQVGEGAWEGDYQSQISRAKGKALLIPN